MVRGDDAEQAAQAEPVPLPGHGGRVRGEDEGRHARQGRTPVPRDQTAVWIHEGSIPRADEKHGADRHAVRVVQPVDGAPKAGLKPARRPGNRAPRRSAEAPAATSTYLNAVMKPGTDRATLGT